MPLGTQQVIEILKKNPDHILRTIEADPAGKQSTFYLTTLLSHGEPEIKSRLSPDIVSIYISKGSLLEKKGRLNRIKLAINSVSKNQDALDARHLADYIMYGPKKERAKRIQEIALNLKSTKIESILSDKDFQRSIIAYIKSEPELPKGPDKNKAIASISNGIMSLIEYLIVEKNNDSNILTHSLMVKNCDIEFIRLVVNYANHILAKYIESPLWLVLPPETRNLIANEIKARIEYFKLQELPFSLATDDFNHLPHQNQFITNDPNELINSLIKYGNIKFIQFLVNHANHILLKYIESPFWLTLPTETRNLIMDEIKARIVFFQSKYQQTAYNPNTLFFNSGATIGTSGSELVYKTSKETEYLERSSLGLDEKHTK